MAVLNARVEELEAALISAGQARATLVLCSAACWACMLGLEHTSKLTIGCPDRCMHAAKQGLPQWRCTAAESACHCPVIAS